MLKVTFYHEKDRNPYFFLQERFLNTYHCCSQESSTIQSSQDFQSLPFLKILYENDDKKKNTLDAETLKTSKLSL